MNEHPNLQIMRRALQAFQSADMATLTTLFAPDVVWHVPGHNRLAGEYRGQAEVFGFFGRLIEATGRTLRIESVDILANDRGGVYIDRLKAERKGKRLDILLLLYVTIRDGQIVEGIDCFHQQDRWDNFLA